MHPTGFQKNYSKKCILSIISPDPFLQYQISLYFSRVFSDHADSENYSSLSLQNPITLVITVIYKECILHDSNI